MSRLRRRYAQLVVAILAGFVVARPSPALSQVPEATPPALPTTAATPCRDFVALFRTRLDFPMQAYARGTDSLEHVLWRSATDECRRAVEQDRAPEVREMLSAALATQPPDASAYAALCALHPRAPWALPFMVEASKRALTPACLAGLMEMDDPTASRAVDDTLADFLFEPGSSSREASDWAVSQSVLRSAELSRHLRDRITPQLPIAYERRADGYAAFWSLACTDKWGARSFSEDRCRALQPPSDDSWDRSRVRWRRAGRVSLALLPGAAAVTAGVLTRNDDSGRAVASVTAAAGAGLAAGTLVYYMVMRGTGGDGSLRGVANAYGLTYATLAALATAIPVGLVSYALLDSSPAARVATTAGGAAAFSICTVLFVWN